MKILAIGDVCGTVGCEKLRAVLPKLKKEYGVDFTLVNGENSADGNGLSPISADMIFSAGADVISGGNHTLRRRDIHALLDENERLLRPHNLPKAEFGHGYTLVDMGFCSVAVINLSGVIYLERLEAENPFLAADELIKKARDDGADIILVDFHAEATSEKRALGFYLDGKVTAVLGTHTHVQTNDAQILECGTAYITDLGMTGPRDSVLGVEKSIIIDRLKNHTTGKFSLAEGPCMVEGVLITADPKTGKAANIEIINIR
ncbi:MAG: TIGR00282 family metallophosphoesterase [Clostridia bacterium]|nr:TIGR00282 family metallophosphoesterase [Clostridia bacterium]